VRTAFAQGIRAQTATKDWLIGVGTSTSDYPESAPINLIANAEPDFGQLVVLQAKIAKALLKIHTQNLSSEQATTNWSRLSLN